MSISSETRKAGPYTGNGVTVAFPFAFKVFSSSDVQVIRTITETETVLTLSTHYTIALNADQDANPGGTVTMLAAPTVGYLITIASVVANFQPVVLTNAGGFYPRAINDALDRTTIIVQQLAEKVSRAVKVNISSSITPDQLVSEIVSAVAVSTAAASSASASAATAANFAEGWQGANNVFTGTNQFNQGVKSNRNYDVTAAVGALQINGADVLRFGSDTSGQLAGFRNKLINGDMRVNQRGVASSTSYGYETCDRMYCVRDGGVAGMTQQQLYGVIPYKHTLRLQRDSGNTITANLSVYQPIEQKNTQDLQGKQVTCSARVAGSGGAAGTTVNFLLAYQTTAADYGVYGPWTVIGGVPQALPIGTSQVLSQTFTVPANATQIMPYLTFSCIGTASSDDSRYITDWQLELGSIATPFENRPISLEISLCRRYYESASGMTALGFLPNTGAAGRRYHITFKESMRAIPTVTSTFNLGAGVTESVTQEGAQFYYTVGDTTSNVLFNAFTASAEL